MRTTTPTALHAWGAGTEMPCCERFERAVALDTQVTFASESLDAQPTLGSPQVDLAGRI